MPAWAGKISENANRALHSSMGSSKSVIILYIFSKCSEIFLQRINTVPQWKNKTKILVFYQRFCFGVLVLQ